jgi:glycosyltransferase involved in cell wall biosynthesis
MNVRRALEQLHTIHRFDLIEFAEWSGFGFRTIQARKMGAAFSDTQIIVKLHSSSQWCRDGNRLWLESTEELIRDYFERYSFENADYQLSPSEYMLDYAKSIGWRVREDARVVRYCNPTAAPEVRFRQSANPELVFFGRLESRKGLKIFLEMARTLPEEMAVSFLGKESMADGAPACELIAKMLLKRPHTILSEFDRDQAMAYLSAGGRLAIMPSLIENYPYTVLECASNAIPFLASNVGGIPEIVAEPDLQEALLFAPNAQALREKIDQYLSSDLATRRQCVKRMQDICNSERNDAVVCQAYGEMLASHGMLHVQEESPASIPPTYGPRTPSNGLHDRPLVSVVVPYYNMGEFLPETMTSIAEQDYAPIELIVVNDGSTDAHALEVLEEMQAKYPQHRFVNLQNRGLGAARNTGLELARGEFFLPVDADNIARPNMVSRFIAAHQRNPELAVATCHFLAFEDTPDIAAGKFVYAYRPCGGPYVAAAMRNVYGDANAMFRTSALRAVGGFETDKDTTCEDWEVYVKLVRNGYQIDVVPEYLFYYRHRPTSLLRTTESIMNRRRVLRQFFAPAMLPEAEQIELWTALASFDEKQREIYNQYYAKQHELWTAHEKCVAKQNELTAALANFNEERLWLQKQYAKANRFGSDARLIVRGVKSVLRKAPYYATVSGRLKKLKRRTA